MVFFWHDLQYIYHKSQERKLGCRYSFVREKSKKRVHFTLVFNLYLYHLNRCMVVQSGRVESPEPGDTVARLHTCLLNLLVRLSMEPSVRQVQWKPRAHTSFPHFIVLMVLTNKCMNMYNAFHVTKAQQITNLSLNGNIEQKPGKAFWWSSVREWVIIEVVGNEYQKPGKIFCCSLCVQV